MNDLTLDELNALASAYLEGRLTRLEEKELELVLMSTEHSSELIEEARETMVASTVLASIRPKAKSRTWSMKHVARLSVAAAACVALAIGVFLSFYKDRTSQESDYIVYINGQQLMGLEAQAAAKDTEARMLAAFAKSVQQAQNIQRECLKSQTLFQ